MRHAPLLALLVPFAAEAAAPIQVPVTGFLTDDVGAAVTGATDFRVRLYTSPTGGTALFDENQSDVDVSNGQFTLYVNATQDDPDFLALFDANSTLYLGLAVNGAAEMTPRLPLATAPYAAYAQYCEDATTLNGDDFADVMRLGDPLPWTDLSGVPPELADGDKDTTYTAGTGLTLTGTQFAADTAYITSTAKAAAYDTTSELTAALAGQYLPNISCPANQTIMSDGVGGWSCAKGTDLALDEAKIDALVANNGYAAQTTVAAIDARLTTAESGLSTVTSGLATANSNIATANSNIATANSNIAALTTAVSGATYNTPSATAPTCDDTRAGQIYYNTSSKRFYGCTGAAGGWVALSWVSSGDMMSSTYTITVDSITGGAPSYVTDRYNITSTGVWTSYCVQTSGSNGHWLKVDFGTPKFITSFSVFGYPGGSHKPISSWILEGSTNDATWTTIGTYDTSQWPADTSGSYPPRPQNILPVQTPGSYRYYRIQSTSNWTNGYMLMCNLAMYEN